MFRLMSDGEGEFYVPFVGTYGAEVRVIFECLGDIGRTIKRIDLIQPLSAAEAVEFGQYLADHMTPSVLR